MHHSDCSAPSAFEGTWGHSAFRHLTVYAFVDGVIKVSPRSYALQDHAEVGVGLCAGCPDGDEASSKP